MENIPLASGASRGKRPERFHRWRKRKDTIARWLIALGGVGVIVAVVLIFFYLLYVVSPLLQPASAERHDITVNADWSGAETAFLAVEEQLELALRVDRSGKAEFVSLLTAEIVYQQAFPVEGSATIVASAAAGEGNGLVALALSDGQVLTFKHEYEMSFEGGIENRAIIPSLSFPYGDRPRPLADGPVRGLALSDSTAEMVIAGYGDDQVVVEWNTKQENFLTGMVELDTRKLTLEAPFSPTGIAISGNHRALYLSDDEGMIYRYSLPGLELQQTIQATKSPITVLASLLGGISILAGDAEGRVTQLFPVRDEQNEQQLQVIRQFEGQGSAVSRIIPEQRRKGFAVLDENGVLSLLHSTAEREALVRELEHGLPVAAALSPRSNAMVLLSQDGTKSLLEIDNEHADVSLSSLWQKVWYENYPEPQYVWQSSAATNEFEPKFSLVPLAFGTFKAALYAMLFAVPLALLCAAYTAYFMAPRMRALVKPMIEIMAALPTVILGFLAGLWFAPFVEEHLTGIFSILIVLPVGLLLFSYVWTLRPSGWLPGGIDGWEAALLLPVLIALIVLAMMLAVPIEHVFFEGNLRDWLSQKAGISYDQRNALVVGVAMGFAVIPTIFSIAEDAVFGVPKSLSDGSLALGATRWQTMVRVVLPTASPGIFSGLMIGLGRAVGETMIVLMATGNTPVMDWNIFEGMRTLAANIAVEMPESEVGSSHYRILFLAALVLFLFTFVVNTGAELVRQRLREKYSSL
jgi:phosphate transport system permease protein